MTAAAARWDLASRASRQAAASQKVCGGGLSDRRELSEGSAALEGGAFPDSNRWRHSQRRLLKTLDRSPSSIFLSPPPNSSVIHCSIACPSRTCLHCHLSISSNATHPSTHSTATMKTAIFALGLALGANAAPTSTEWSVLPRISWLAVLC